MAALVGWTAHELFCLIDRYDGAWPEQINAAFDRFLTSVDRLRGRERSIA